MAELSEYQLEQAKQAMWKVPNVPLAQQYVWDDMIRAAAPHLQMPWDEPTTIEAREIADGVWDKSVSHFHDLEVSRVTREFVRRRNAALQSKPVDPRIDRVIMAMQGRGPIRLGQDLRPIAEKIIAALDEVR